MGNHYDLRFKHLAVKIQVSHMYSTWRSISSGRLLLTSFLGMLSLCLSGCGGSGAISQSDLARYGISRGDDDEDTEDEESSAEPAPIASPPASNVATTPPPPTATAKVEVSPPPTNLSRTEVSRPAPPKASSTAEASVATAEPDAIAGIVPISKRNPAQPLSQNDRRRISASNVQKLTGTLVDWINQNPVVQTSVLRDSVGRPGLSWRVQILPLLGYQELYDRFNLREPWDSPQNMKLLEYIPDEFVSPERFDTYTNYQLFVNGAALFSETERKDKTEISDAPSVLLLAEVDDAAAVPWTSPFDYDFREEPLDRALGNLREDGVFVGWMTGQAALWPKPINTRYLFNAITFEAGDALPFSQFMEYPPVEAGGSNRPTLGGASAALATSQSQPRTSGTRSDPSEARSATANIRNPLPDRQEILAAEGKMRQTYEASFNRARTPTEYAALAREIYQLMTSNRSAAVSSDYFDDGDPRNRQAREPSSMPPADLYVGLRTALNVAVRGRDPKLAEQILEELNQQFDISLADFESKMFEGFLGDKGTLRTELNKAANLIPRLEELIVSNIQDDDFRSAETNLDYGLSVVRTINNIETNYRWKVLKERVDEGKRYFPRIAQHIETLRNDPENAAANFAVGWYLCIVKGNWQEGASMLAKAPDRSLRELALLEVQQDGNTNREIALADGWWDYGQEHKDETLIFQAAMQRSRKWYLSFRNELPDGIDRIRANRRLDAIDKLIGREPDLNGVVGSTGTL